VRAEVAKVDIAEEHERTRPSKRLKARVLRDRAGSWAIKERRRGVGDRSGLGVSVLLRQAYGFEGFGVIPEVIDVEDLALAHRLDARQLDG